VTGRSRHLEEDHLIECYAAERSGDAVDPRLVDHLVECAECGTRYQDLARFMDDLRSEGDAEVDEVFSDDRLRTERQEIARRIEHLGHMARVISFPVRPTEEHPDQTLAPRASRWVAMAAAAGLLVGLGLGVFTNLGARLRVDQVATSHPAAAAPVMPAAAPDSPAPQTVLDDDAFLQELEIARGGLRARALTPLDAFTPTVREVSAQLR
jgi:hypothetical protein